MNRFALIAVAGFLALTLTACGENNNKPTVDTKTDHVSTQAAAQPNHPAANEHEQPLEGDK